MQRLSLHTIKPGDAFSIHRFGPACTSDFPLHTHQDFHEIFMVVSGQVIHAIDGRVSTLQPGDVMFVRSGDAHALGFRKTHFINLNIPVSEWTRLGDYLGRGLDLSSLISAAQPTLMSLKKSQHRALVADLNSLFYRQHEPDSRTALAGVLVRWLPLLIATVPPLQPTASPPSWLHQLLPVIDDQLEQSLTVGDLPRLAGVSREHLARSLRRHLGLTPTAWLNERRLRRAELLLQRTDRGLADIAFTLGFGSLSWFHRAFQARHGCTPGAWRVARQQLEMS